MAPHRTTLVLALLFATPWAAAQTPPTQTPPARPDPLDAKAAVPPLRHDSVLRLERRATDEPRADWKQANELTARIGGWRAYAREAAAPEKPASAPR
jgi:hypothetical protein